MPATPVGTPHAVLVDLQAVFGTRLQSFVAYALDRTPQPSLAIVASLTFEDLAACAKQARRWHRGGLATPVVLVEGEFNRSLDAFPIEFGEIIATHQTLFGPDPFAGLAVETGDLRRACETQIRSLLLHLREDYMEAGAEAKAVKTLVVESAPEFRAILSLLARLDGRRLASEDLPSWASQRLGLAQETIADLLQITAKPDRHKVDAVRIFPAYLAATEMLARRIDTWV